MTGLTITAVRAARLAGLLGGWTFLVAPAGGHGTADSHADNITEVIASGGVYELCRVLTPDQQLDYDFTATRPLDFNIHYHAGREVSYPVPEHRTAAAGAVFVAGSEQEYCLMWTNPASADVTLSLKYKQGHR